MSKLAEEINERLINEYISKVRCCLRSDLRTGMVAGSSLKYQDRIDRYIKALDDVIAANMPEGCE